MTLNLILLIGNAGRDAELRFTPNGNQVANFSLAVNRNYQVNGEWQQETEWFNVSSWGRQAEVVSQRVRRGSRVFVEGRLSTRSYTTESGERRTTLEVNAFRVLNLTGQSEEEGQSYGTYGDGAGWSGQQPSQQPATGGTPPQGADHGVTMGQDYAGPEGGDLEDLPW